MAEVSGALSQPKHERYNMAQFQKGERVAKRFLDPFQIAHDSFVGTPKGPSEEKTAESGLAKM